MIATKPGIAFSYMVSGGTSAAGGANLIQEQAPMLIDPHTIMGFSLPEVALLIGIIGTFATMFFQYLNYRNNKLRTGSADSSSEEDHKKKNDK